MIFAVECSGKNTAKLKNKLNYLKPELNLNYT